MPSWKRSTWALIAGFLIGDIMLLSVSFTPEDMPGEFWLMAHGGFLCWICGCVLFYRGFDEIFQEE
ncbi:MAG: hypothetical protein ACXABY_16140 [Candidatus Thorarchaeota archaeon]